MKRQEERDKAQLERKQAMIERKKKWEEERELERLWKIDEEREAERTRKQEEKDKWRWEKEEKERLEREKKLALLKAKENMKWAWVFHEQHVKLRVFTKVFRGLLKIKAMNEQIADDFRLQKLALSGLNNLLVSTQRQRSDRDRALNAWSDCYWDIKLKAKAVFALQAYWKQ